MYNRTFAPKFIFFIFIILYFITLAISSKENENINKPKPKKINKDVRDMTDADLENLLDQWEEGDDPLEPDELPEHLRPQPEIDFTKIDMKNPDDVLKISKKGKSVMMFVDVKEELSEAEANNILSIWQGALHNNHIIAERYPVDKKRAIFMFRDGSQSVDAKNYLIEQPECSHVTLEGHTHIGRYAPEMATKLTNTAPKGTAEKVEL